MTPEQRDKYEREEAEYRAWTAYYGSQYYGGWDRDPLDGRYKPKAVIEAQRLTPPVAAVSAAQNRGAGESQPGGSSRKPAEAVQAIEKEKTSATH